MLERGPVEPGDLERLVPRRLLAGIDVDEGERRPVRPAPGAPVSAPITWDELDDPALRANSFTVRNVVERVAKVGDLFAGAQTDLQELPKLG